MKVYQNETLALVLRHPELQGKTLRVLLALEGLANYENKVPPVVRIAERLGMRQSHVSRAYGHLLLAGALVRLDGVYHISPALCWKGTERQLDRFYEALAVEDRRALPSPVEA